MSPDSYALAENERRSFWILPAEVVNSILCFRTGPINRNACLCGGKTIAKTIRIFWWRPCKKRNPRLQGIGYWSAAWHRTHHYVVDENGMITRCNLIVSTTHNNDAMNRAVKWVAEMLSAIKALSPMECWIRWKQLYGLMTLASVVTTHAIGKMPLKIQLYNFAGVLLDERTKN